MKPTKKYALLFFDTFCHQLLNEKFPARQDSVLQQVAALQQEHLICTLAIKKAMLSTAGKASLGRFLSQHLQEARQLLNLLSARQAARPEWRKQHAALLEELLPMLAGICSYLEACQGRLLYDVGSPTISNLPQVLEEISGSYQEVAALLPYGKLSEQLTKHIKRFISGKRLRFERTKDSVEYMRSLLGSIKTWDWTNQSEGFTPIERLLIYYNFNTKAVMDILVQELAQALKNCPFEPDKMLLLLDRMRSFKQLHRKPGFCLNRSGRSIDDFLNQWFESELQFLRAKLAKAPQLGAETPLPADVSDSAQARFNKIHCLLSVDQLGILLRAADESKLIEARSLNQVFRLVVPHLATTRKEELSPSSMRVKSYRPEPNDKELVLKKLQLMISKIQTY